MTMRDSWIDKDELDELVQAFSPKKGRKSSSRVRKKKKVQSEKSNLEEAGEKAVEDKGIEKETDEPAGMGKGDSLEISSIDLIDEYANSGAGVVEWDVGEVELVEEQSPVDERDLVIDEISDESEKNFQRRADRFLGGGETDDIREAESNPSASEADSVKAVKVLAEARDRADQGGLIRNRKESVGLETGNGPEHVEESDRTDLAEAEEQHRIEPEQERLDFSFVDDVDGEDLFADIALPSPAEETDFSKEGTIRRRMAKFARLLQEKLQATDVMVMDGDGFPLYEEKTGAESILIEKSGGPLRLVYKMQNIATAAGLEDRVSTQISVGNGRWLCLLYSAEMSDDGPMVRAVIPRALEEEQLQKWSNLLGAALLLDEENIRSETVTG